ncbi:MAG: hypothetical protein ACTSXA_15880 [Candidatus Heimdallarchaeota archaeon]
MTPNNDSRRTQRKKKRKEEWDYSNILTISDEKKQRFKEQFTSLIQKNVPKLWEEPYSKEYWIPVDGGEIRVLHIKPEKPTNSRPVLFISGWQSMPYQFEDMYEIIYNRVEIYFVETREKYTSKIKRRKADLSVSQKAKDVQAVIDYFKLENQDFVLFGTCWGATIVFQGLLDKTLKAPTIVTFSPMHKIWFPKFVGKYILPFLPTFFVAFLLRIASYVMFIGEKAETQKNRMLITIREAEVWKWRKATLAANNLYLFGKLSEIQEEIPVISGTHDLIHSANDYPKFAEELPNGRFYYFGFDDSNRERAIGLILLEYSKITSNQKVPEFFIEYEKEL